MGFLVGSVNKQGSSFLTHPTSTPTPTSKKDVFLTIRIKMGLHEGGKLVLEKANPSGHQWLPEL